MTSYERAMGIICLGASLPLGSVREAARWAKRIEYAAQPRAEANRFIKRHRPEEHNLAGILNFTEIAACR